MKNLCCHHEETDDNSREVENERLRQIDDDEVACLEHVKQIPTMTKSHHGGEMSIMIRVAMCQCQIPTIHDKLQLQHFLLVVQLVPSAKTQN